MEKIKSSRIIGFLILLGVYSVASVAGIFIYRALPFSDWLNLLISDVSATILTFAVSLFFGNSSVYDPYWSVQPIVILGYAAVINGMNPTRWLLLVCVCVWGIRLTANWAYTFKDLNHQDWRYTMLREKTGALYPFVNFAGIHMFPTLVVYFCTLPAVFVFREETGFGVWNVLFCAVSLGAVVLQGTADLQMQRFRKNVHHGFIRTGLWKHARHPNYLGEILMWWGIGLSAVSVMPERWYLLAGALVNTLMFLIVSIPMADRRQSSKEGFEEYKKATNKLLPIRKIGLTK